MYDVIIVGAGPSGATLARLIGQKYRVLVIEKRDFNKERFIIREKSCGGLVAPDAQMMLARFGLGIPKNVLQSPQIFAVRVLDFDNSLERYYQRNYINVDRENFDRWIASLIPDRVKIEYNSLVRSFKVEDDGVTVKFTKDGKEYEEKAEMIVGADGANSKIRREGFKTKSQLKQYITIQEWYKKESNIDYHSAIFDREITDFYSWIIPKEDALIVGSALVPGSNAGEKFELLKEKLNNKGFVLGDKIKTSGAYLARPTNANQILTGIGRVALIGEAAGFISPSSAEGLSYGFRSALALSTALNEDFLRYDKLYKSYTRSLSGNIILKNMKTPFMYNKYLRKMVMKSGLSSLKVE
ncbi:MAG: FAD-binding protein [Gudongella sp.]|nr:FAD-binding protein [Gudongella sp.]